MAECVRGCKDDDSTPRSSHPSLRDHRDRQRVLALQEPRLTDHRGLPRWANRQPPARAVPPLVGALHVTRGSLLFATWTSALRSLQRGVPFACRSGVPFPCRLTRRDPDSAHSSQKLASRQILTCSRRRLCFSYEPGKR